MTVRLWNISVISQRENKLVMTGHQHVIECCAPTSYRYIARLAGLKHDSLASSAAEFMATGSRDKTIKIWDARGTCFKTLIGHDNWVRAITFHPGGKYLLSVSDDRTLRCWDLSQEGRCVKTLTDVHERFVTCLRRAPGIVKNAPTDYESSYEAPPSGDCAKARAKVTGVEFSDVQIRCVIATGGVDRKLRIFAS
jgi:platelet-activating factor acetylhydrolase IB subunit alpha